MPRKRTRRKQSVKRDTCEEPIGRSGGKVLAVGTEEWKVARAFGAGKGEMGQVRKEVSGITPAFRPYYPVV